MLLLIFATFEFSRMLYQYNALNKVVRDAARYLIVHSVNGSTQNVSISPADELVARSLIIRGYSGNSSELLPNLSTADIDLTSSGKFITIEVIYAWQPVLFSVMPSFGFGESINLSFPLKVTYTMRGLVS